MSASCRCQGCGDLLPRADAICPRCDAALSTPPAQTGRFVCPHCHTPLRDRFASLPPRWLVAVAIAAAVASQLFTTGWTRLLLGLAILGTVYAPLAWTAWRHRAHRHDPHRFVPGTTRLWAQGNDRLRRPSAF
jgi:uncharacterized paraquat-inducible protein A